MVKIKETYVSPTTDALELAIEAHILSGSDEVGSPSSLPSFTQDYDDWS